jgi:hypothetical protein
MPTKLGARSLVIALALTNGFLYVCALPLWEGFDEPFHYAYVQSVSVKRRLPVLNQSRVSEEICQSLKAVPLSRLLAGSVPDSISFEAWSKLDDAAKVSRLQALEPISPELRGRPSSLMNYEAQQAPLAYLTLAPFDAFLSGLHLANRVLILRLLVTAGGALLLFAGLERLAQTIGLRDAFEIAALACVFESQMLWASIAHIGNDWLAVPLTVCWVACLAITMRKPSARNVLLLAMILALGLLAKAYFLAFVPVFIALLVYLAVRKFVSWGTLGLALAIVAGAGAPWYVHNLFLYGSLSGTQQSVAGIGIARAFDALAHINWAESTVNFARWSLWTGNWSFVSFSKNTLNAELILLMVAFGCYLLQWRSITAPQIWTLLACAWFAAGLIYQAGVAWVHTNGISTNPEPWYAQGIIACLWILCFLALQRGKTAARWIASALVMLTAWVAAATYLAKLLPYYGGAVTRSSARAVLGWWSRHPTMDLSAVLVVPVWVVYLLLAVFSAVLVVTTAQVLILLWRPIARY